jgi:hypothetical protein
LHCEFAAGRALCFAGPDGCALFFCVGAEAEISKKKIGAAMVLKFLGLRKNGAPVTVDAERLSSKNTASLLKTARWRWVVRIYPRSQYGNDRYDHLIPDHKKSQGFHWYLPLGQVKNKKNNVKRMRNYVYECMRRGVTSFHLKIMGPGPDLKEIARLLRLRGPTTNVPPPPPQAPSPRPPKKAAARRADYMAWRRGGIQREMPNFLRVAQERRRRTRG